jgi:hypothetical protein
LSPVLLGSWGILGGSWEHPGGILGVSGPRFRGTGDPPHRFRSDQWVGDGRRPPWHHHIEPEGRCSAEETQMKSPESTQNLPRIGAESPQNLWGTSGVPPGGSPGGSPQGIPPRRSLSVMPPGNPPKGGPWVDSPRKSGSVTAVGRHGTTTTTPPTTNMTIIKSTLQNEAH